MTDDVLIRAEGVSKKYCKTIKHTMLYGVSDISTSFLGLKGNSEELRAGEFWAVEDINFELRRGECLGLIGLNGAGKSTLLKLLNGIFMPDKGKIEMNGRVGALIEVGAGFHPLLTGRENIYVNGSILGMSKDYIDKKFDAIVDFAELEEFIDSPVKHYSSGMYVRLGFAIAAQMEPDILLIDEVLAVGDLNFAIKCFNAIDKLVKDAAVIYVSHNMDQIARICSKVIVMGKGREIYKSENAMDSIEYYYSTLKPVVGSVMGSGRATIHSVDLYAEGSETKSFDGLTRINFRDTVSLEMEFSVVPEVEECNIAVQFNTRGMAGAGQCFSIDNGFEVINNAERLKVKVDFKEFPLSPGKYNLTVSIYDKGNSERLA
ncbi:MAG: ABC transporter ATP-binding protein, partial [Thermodesulfobacteriota bacterium]